MPSQLDVAVMPAGDDPRADYSAPALRELGDVRDLTLGSSPGTGDSGGSGTFRTPPPPSPGRAGR